jgi:hypothetical protein
MAIDGDRFGDRQRAKAAWIEAIVSPLVAVFEVAPANVLQGAVREQVREESSPTPETQVRVACA